jgi:hypothetical protein
MGRLRSLDLRGCSSPHILEGALASLLRSHTSLLSLRVSQYDNDDDETRVLCWFAYLSYTSRGGSPPSSARTPLS